MDGSGNAPCPLDMRSYILVAAAASGQLSYADGAIVWYEPADGVPLSGLESAQACESRGQRLCLYDELCPSGENSQPVGMPSSHSDWMPFISTTYGRRWMTGGCQVHEDLYDEGCDVPGCGTGSPCANECCDHGWCTTPGADGCDSASGSFNGYTGSCKGSYACCFEECAAPSLAPSSAPIPDESDSKANFGIIIGSVIGVCCLLVSISPWVYFKMRKANSVVIGGVEPPIEVEQVVGSAVNFSTQNKFCGDCGVSLNAGNKYCSNCGNQTR